MRLAAIANTLGLTDRVGADAGAEATSGYASDLLSDVLARAKEGTIWVTNQKHQNVVGVAVMLNLAAVIIAGGVQPDENTVEKAKAENVPLYSTDMTLYEVVGRLYEMGVRSA